MKVPSAYPIIRRIQRETKKKYNKIKHCHYLEQLRYSIAKHDEIPEKKNNKMITISYQ